jgi:hypothetical protein
MNIFGYDVIPPNKRKHIQEVKVHGIVAEFDRGDLIYSTVFHI